MEYFNINGREGALQAIKLCEIIRSMNADTQRADNLIAKVTEVYGVPTEYTFWPSTVAHPCGGVFRFDDLALLVSHGTDDIAQAVGETHQYTPTLAEAIGFNQQEYEQPTCRFNENAGAFVATQMGILSHRSITRLTVVGHSFGHPVTLEAFRAFYRGTGEAIPITDFYSFGGNGSANREKQAWLDDNARHVRVCNSDDPVPCAPWIFGQAVGTLLALTPRLISRLGNYVHVGPGLILDENGGSDWDVLPPISRRTDVVRFAALADWFWSFVGDTVTPHNTSQYISRLQKYADSLPVVPLQQPPVVMPAEPYPPLPPRGRESEFIRDESRTAAEAISRTPTGSVVITQPTQGNMDSTLGNPTFIPTNIYVVRKQGNSLYGVVQNGVVHSVYASKKAAKKESKRLNRSRPRNQ